MRIAAALTIACILLLGPLSVRAEDSELCMFTDATGRVQQVTGRTNVPEAFQSLARCFAESRRAKNSEPRTSTISRPRSLETTPKIVKSASNGSVLASPEDISLKGTIRREQISSAVGRIELRWPRKVELLFGRTPSRAMQDAALVVSKVLRSSGFPAELQRMNQDWQVVFMDEELPETQIPSYLVDNCHPAWMTPPAKLYVVSQRVVAGCGQQNQRPSQQVADAQLAQILIHEMGHAVEYQLLKEQFAGDRMRAEGFASWFEQYGSELSAVIPKGSARARYVGMAQQAIRQSPNSFAFQGSGPDYARASMFFNAIVSRRGIRGLNDVYSLMSSQRKPFLVAIDEALGWDARRLNDEVSKFVFGTR